VAETTTLETTEVSIEVPKTETSEVTVEMTKKELTTIDMEIKPQEITETVALVVEKKQEVITESREIHMDIDTKSPEPVVDVAMTFDIEKPKEEILKVKDTSPTPVDTVQVVEEQKIEPPRTETTEFSIDVTKKVEAPITETTEVSLDVTKIETAEKTIEVTKEVEAPVTETTEVTMDISKTEKSEVSVEMTKKELSTVELEVKPQETTEAVTLVVERKQEVVTEAREIHMEIDTKSPEPVQEGAFDLEKPEEEILKVKDTSPVPIGTVEITDEQKVEEPIGEAPQFVKTLEDTHTTEGKPMRLECKVTGIPRPNITWLLDDEELQDTTIYDIVYTEDCTCVLTIHESFPEDEGDYSCKAVNEYGEAITTAELTVTGKDASPARDQTSEMEIMLTKEQVAESTEISLTLTKPEDITFTTESTEQEFVIESRVTDQLNGMSITENGESHSSSTFSTTSSTTTSTTSSTSVDDSEDSDASTVVEEPLSKRKTTETTISTTTKTMSTTSEKSETKMVIENNNASAPVFTKYLEPLIIKDGDQAKFECVVEGDPRPSIVWFREEDAVQPSADFVMEYTENNVCTLEIKEVFPEDAGTYIAMAENDAGTTSCSASLVVEVEEEEVVGPSFVKTPKYKTAEEGETVVFECTFVAQPEPEISWYVNDTEIKSDDHFEISVEREEENTYTVTLTINGVKVEDAGNYKIVVRNDGGDASVSVSLIVNKTIKEITDFTSQLKTEVKTKVGVQYDVKQHDFTSQLKTPRKTKVGVQYDVEQKDFRSTLKPSPLKSSKYETDTKPEEEPRFVVQISDVHVKEGEAARFDCTVEGTPEPSVTFYFLGAPVDADGDIYQVEQGPDGTHSLILPECFPEDAGEYTVKAVNSVGFQEVSAMLTVEEYFSDTSTISSKKEEEAPIEPELPVQDAAATKIQAAFRGMQARKEVEIIKHEKQEITITTTETLEVAPQEVTEVTTEEITLAPDAPESVEVTMEVVEPKESVVDVEQPTFKTESEQVTTITESITMQVGETPTGEEMTFEVIGAPEGITLDVSEKPTFTTTTEKVTVTTEQIGEAPQAPEGQE
ncbi:unnamed protein product, partial [Owenia fusiformis]